MDVNTDPQKIDELLGRGVTELIHQESIREKLASGRRLRVKLGIDPTSPNLHLGRSVPLLKMRDFQELGHQVVLIVGDFTGVIGDTSDKESERPMLSREIIEENKQSYLAQIGTILDLDRVEFRYNSEWLGGLDYNAIGEHADQFSVADFIARENIKRRLDAGKRVSLREVLYPLMQGYDSVAVEADIEIGGVDQRFNLLAGRTLQEHFGQTPQDLVMTTFPIEGLDGRKMSSSWGNTINFTAAPEDMYGKVMSVHDDLIVKYLTVLTRVPLVEVEEIARALEQGANPRDAKMRLAREIVTLYHDADAAQEAEEAFVGTFQKGQLPEEIEEVMREGGESYADALVRLGIVASKSELTRLLRDGGVRDAETGEKYEELPDAPGVTLKLGKRRFVRLA